MLTAQIFDIQHFSVHDGPGIRTTVFFKGCPLRCIWCHNPESWEKRTELNFVPAKCTGCGGCVGVCPNNVHSIVPDEDADKKFRHNINRSKCVTCGKCTDRCWYGALELCGKQYTADEVIADVMKDKIFYETGSGGMTLSGGEPFAQYDFALELLKKGKEAGLHICVETCGYVDTDKLLAAAEYVDIFLFDCKETDPIRHKEYTGVDNTLIMHNLRALSDNGSKIVLRCPIIPGLNDREEHLTAVGKLAESLEGIYEVNLEPYHPLGTSKAENLGKTQPYQNREFLDKKTAAEHLEVIKAHTTKKAIIM